MSPITAAPAVTRRALRGGALAASAFALTGLLTPTASAAPAHAQALDWRRCASVAKDWPVPGDQRTECAELTVPLDYTKPQGRTITIVVSRIKATGQHPGEPLVFGAGGPGTENASALYGLLGSRLGTLNSDHDLIAMDARGTGYSQKISCETGTWPEPPVDASQKERIKAEFDGEAEYNKRCTAIDPDFVRQLTPANIARDIDTLRNALGAEKIDFFGESFDTATGLAYRSLFDERVNRMWLDSPVPPVFDHSAMDGAIEALGERGFKDFCRWLAEHDYDFHLGTDKAAIEARLVALREELDRAPRVSGDLRLDGQWAAGVFSSPRDGWVDAANDLVTVLDGGTPGSAASSAATVRRPYGLGDPLDGLNAVQYNAMLCNVDPTPTDFPHLWSAAQARRAAHPAVGGAYISPWCADWPVYTPPTPVVRGNSPVQISGHLDEGTTPYAWAEQAHEAAGGTFLTVRDDVHASLKNLPCGARVVEFFRTGKTTSGSCPGVK
ncbi:alpha/beta fold hydrolase [Streptomyces olivaceoviridis]|uniref:alpha/beta fold hydrolase n=1 Tax=Streptomyces olivaceoviridis TaxID=1921 RepID=UPI0036F87B08